MIFPFIFGFQEFEYEVFLLSENQLFVTPWTVACHGSSVPGILQVRILKWVVVSFSRGSSQPRDRIQVSHIIGTFFTIWATKEALE